jgi:hypothetical protein
MLNGEGNLAVSLKFGLLVWEVGPEGVERLEVYEPIALDEPNSSADATNFADLPFTRRESVYRSRIAIEEPSPVGSLQEK